MTVSMNLHDCAVKEKQRAALAAQIAEYERSSSLLKQCQDYQSRAERFAQQAQALAAEVDRLNETIAKLAAEGQDAHEM